MEEKQLGGICAGTRVWKDSDKMLAVFCEDGFVYSVLARGALKPKYKLKFAAQLFSACDYFLCAGKAGYYILGGATFGELSLLGISSDPEAYAAACVVCEAVQKSVLSENKRMYAETVAALGELAAGGSRSDIIVLRVLIAAFVSNGLGAAFPEGSRGELCKSVATAQAGNLSELDCDKTEIRALIKQYARKFALQFGKLNSLGFYLGE